jgi:hypothetical protein
MDIESGETLYQRSHGSAAIVHQTDFEITPGLGAEIQQTLGQQLFAIVSRDNNGDQWA